MLRSTNKVKTPIFKTTHNITPHLSHTHCRDYSSFLLKGLLVYFPFPSWLLAKIRAAKSSFIQIIEFIFIIRKHTINCLKRYNVWMVLLITYMESYHLIWLHIWKSTEQLWDTAMTKDSTLKLKSDLQTEWTMTWSLGFYQNQP